MLTRFILENKIEGQFIRVASETDILIIKLVINSDS